ncbi:MAG TPA: hypothetical protein VGK74_22410 [Symbiobacteriaceae bacterium]|jgi:hypothetical protein
MTATVTLPKPQPHPKRPVRGLRQKKALARRKRAMVRVAERLTAAEVHPIHRRHGYHGSGG